MIEQATPVNGWVIALPTPKTIQYVAARQVGFNVRTTYYLAEAMQFPSEAEALAYGRAKLPKLVEDKDWRVIPPMSEILKRIKQ